ncbi:solute carrier organic anion transporter family member 2A1-like [Acanthaster planci]|uniref:Solute carrier organic anion transporter family member n=1 Tax=Acanthaster planci TaxID=133434 RepID=A0A8B7XRL5_ACAPL|nr:solute carrier organic anion transporter family member 2A1-like [Acanthaster planci]
MTADQKYTSHPKYHHLPTEKPSMHNADVDPLDFASGDDSDWSPRRESLCPGFDAGVVCRRLMRAVAHPNTFVLMTGLLYLGVYGCSGIYLSAVISTIEKRFQLKSSESGLLMSLNDISALCGVLFVAHMGGKYHRSRIIGISGLVVALGSFMSALPQFLYDNSMDLEGLVVSEDGNRSEEFLCGSGTMNATVCTAEEIEASGSQLSKTWALIIGQLLAGLGTAGLGPLAVTYVDDAVEKNLLPLYLSLMWLPMTIAPLIGFSLSSYCLSIFADYYKTDAAQLEIGPTDPQWQGAWWLGFVIYGCYLCLVSLPYFLLPRKMHKPKSYCCFSGVPDCCTALMGKGRGGQFAEDVSMTGGAISHNTLSGEPLTVVKDFLSSLGRLLSNVIFMSSMAGFCLWVLSFGGFSVFSAKYLQFEFGASPSEAGMLLGFTHLPGSLLGIMLGGIITSRLTGNQRGYSFLSITMHTLSVLVFVILTFLGCPNNNIAGLTTRYNELNHSATNGLDLYSACNMNCTCESGIYSPVCGSDNVTYVTACFAGCQSLSRDQSKTILQDCSCVGPSEQRYPHYETTSSFAIPGECASSCGLLIPFVIMVGVSTATGSFSYNPSFMMYFRSVLEKDRSLAMGVMSFLTKTLGFIPGPVIFGAMIETQCSYWQESCQETGECLLYDRPGLRLVMVGLTTAFRLLATLSFCVSALFVLKSLKNLPIEKEDGSKDEKAKKPEELVGMLPTFRETEV